MYLYGVISNFHMHDYNIGQIKMLVEIGYWRKANQIHKWFVDNIQNGIDNCAQYYLDKEQLLELKELCKQVLEQPEKAHEILPTESGFFFGSQEYDEWYYDDIKETIKIINWIMDKDYDYFAYSSSW